MNLRPALIRVWAPALALALAVAFTPAASAQDRSAGDLPQVLRGIVRDAETGAPLIDADVRVADSRHWTYTDAYGRFRLPLPRGASRADLSVTRVGYEVLERAVALGDADAGDLELALTPSPIRMPEIQVVGHNRTSLDRTPGSVEIVSRRRVAAMVPLTGNEVLKSVAGVHLQEEEGLGLRANIGIRGLNPDRSRTVLVLEDGVPVALNPYGEPELYYTPPIDRMERVEVLKGSGSILFGPQTIGGVINYVTPSLPVQPEGSLSFEGGGSEFFRALASYGATWNGAGARLGVMHRRVGDLAGLFANVSDVTGKVGVQMGDRSTVGLKLSIYDELSNSTYVGLTQAMFDADPLQHPAPDDRLRLRRYAVSGTHDLTFGAGSLRTTAYAYTTTRDWQRQNYGYTPDGSGIVLQPSTGNRNRSFEVYGVEPRIQLDHALGGLRHELEAGVRAQHEWAEDAQINGTTSTARTGTVQDYEIRTGDAFSAFVQNRVFVTDRFQVVPGLRIERFSYERNILRTRVRRDDGSGGTTRLPEDVDIRSGDELTELIPGIGVTWVAADRLTVFAGAHRGFSPPRVKDALVYDDQTLPLGTDPGDPVSLQLDAERSLNLELGVRSTPARALSVEAALFLIDFSNQIIAPSLSAGSAAQVALANQGETRHRGVESMVGIQWSDLVALPLGLSTQVKHTWVQSEFSADRFMVNAGDTVNVKGNRLPYAPEHLWTLTLGVEQPSGLTLHVDWSRVDEQFSDNFETVTASANGRNGLIRAYSIWNAAATYRLPNGIQVFGTVKNLTGATYIASRRPEGIKPGMPRLVQAGMRVSF